MNIPVGYAVLTPYLIVKNASGFIEFMKNVFDAEEKMKYMQSDDGGKIMHAEIDINGSVLMLADSSDTYKPMPAGLFVYVESADETYQKALDNGAVSIQEPTDKDYGRGAGVIDPFGNTWWITTPPEE